ncbi:MAG: A/G-specific adenine glycosylase [Silvibacterium sp.]
MSSKPEPVEYRRRLLGWFDENARDLPWRRSRDPYAIWVSEIMLQQTRVAAVLEHYSRFTERFPTLEVLAAATEDEVLAHWSGLGYYRRARMLHKAAGFVLQQRDGKLPSTAAELRTLPGVGEYTCAAIASIGFGEAVACVDGNVERVLRRIRGWDEGRGTATKVRVEAARLLDVERPGDFNQAMMELGATLCLPRGPLCVECPVRKLCATRGEHPVAERKKMRSQESAYAFMRRSPQPRAAEVLLEKRPLEAAVMAGMWELPAVDPGHAEEKKKVLTVRHSITDTNYYVAIYDLDPAQQRYLPKRKAVRRWFRVRDLDAVPLTGLTRKVLKRLRAWPGFEGPGPAVPLERVQPGILH